MEDASAPSPHLLPRTRDPREQGGYVKLEAGQRVHIPGKELTDWVTIDEAVPVDGGWKLYVKDDHGAILRVELSESDSSARSASICT
jgi:hypothetical protein